MAENVLGPRTFSSSVQGVTSQAQGNVSPQGPSGGVSGGASGLTELSPGGDFAGAAAVNQADFDAIWKLAEKVAEPKLRKLQEKRQFEGMSRVARGATSEQIENEKPWFMNLFGTTPYEVGAAAFDSSAKATKSLAQINEQMDELKKLSPEQANERMFEIFEQNSQGMSGVASAAFNNTFKSKLPELMQVHQAANYKYRQEELSKSWLENANSSLALYNQLAERSARDGTVSEETLYASRQHAMMDLQKAPGQTDESYAQSISAALAMSAQNGNLHAYRIFEESGATKNMTVAQRLQYEHQKHSAEKVAASYYLANPQVQQELAALNASRVVLPPEEWIPQALAFDERYKQATGATQGVMNIADIGTKAANAIFEQRKAQAAAEAARTMAESRASLDAEIGHYMVGEAEEIRGRASGLMQRSAEIRDLAIMTGNLSAEKAHEEHETRIRRVQERAYVVGDKLAERDSEVAKSSETDRLKQEKMDLVQLSLARGDAGSLSQADLLLSKEELATVLSKQAQSIRQQVAIQAASNVPGASQEAVANDPRVKLQQNMAVIQWVGRLKTDSHGTPLPQAFIDTELMSGTAHDAFQRNADSDSFNRIRPFLQAAKMDETGKVAAVLSNAWGDRVYSRLQEVSSRADESPMTPMKDVWNEPARLENARRFPENQTEIDSLFVKAEVPLPAGVSGAKYRSAMIGWAKDALANGRASTPQEAINVAKFKLDENFSFAGDQISWPVAQGQQTLKTSLQRNGLVYDKKVAESSFVELVRSDFPAELQELARKDITERNITVVQGDENGMATMYHVIVENAESPLYGKSVYLTRSQLMSKYREKSMPRDYRTVGTKASNASENPLLFQGDNIPGMFELPGQKK